MPDLILGEQLRAPSHNHSAITYLATYDDQLAVAKHNPNVEQLNREQAVLAATDDPHIPKVYDRIEHDDKQWLVMQRMPGEPLARKIKLSPAWSSQTLDKTESISIVSGLADCMLALRRAGYLYHDLNLDHIIVDRSQVSLVDNEWDMAIRPDGTARVNSMLSGTWETMAPEEFIFNDEAAVVTEASSVYSLGTVLMQLGLGKNPFYVPPRRVPDIRRRRLATRDLHRRPALPELLDKSLGAVARVALEAKPENRFQSIAEFQTALLEAA